MVSGNKDTQHTLLYHSQTRDNVFVLDVNKYPEAVDSRSRRLELRDGLASTSKPGQTPRRDSSEASKTCIVESIRRVQDGLVRSQPGQERVYPTHLSIRTQPSVTHTHVDRHCVWRYRTETWNELHTKTIQAEQVLTLASMNQQRPCHQLESRSPSDSFSL